MGETWEGCGSEGVKQNIKDPPNSFQVEGWALLSAIWLGAGLILGRGLGSG